MAGSILVKLACAALLLCMLGGTAHCAQAAMTCGQVTSNLASCIAYLTDTGPLLPSCCTGMGALKSAAITTPDRQQACNCIKSAANEIQNLNYNLAAGLPGKCGVPIDYAISPNFDCSSIK